MTNDRQTKGTIMPIQIDPKIVSKIPLAKIFKLIRDLITFSKGGISADERALLLEDLASIALQVAEEAL
jgi:hypothetical protein